MSPSSLTVASRFQGLPGIAHGGYTAGLLASSAEWPAAEARFAQPAPVEQPLSAEVTAKGTRLTLAEHPLVDLTPTTLDIDAPPLPTWSDAAAASVANAARVPRPSPGCFACGPDRAAGDGLRVFVGPVDGQVAGVWTPPLEIADPDGSAPLSVVWAAMDCASYWSIAYSDLEAPEGIMTARLAVERRRSFPAGEPVMVLAWPLAARGGRLFTAEAVIVSATEELLALARATWVST